METPENPRSSKQTAAGTTPSRALLTAALSGLLTLGAAAACADKQESGVGPEAATGGVGNGSSSGGVTSSGGALGSADASAGAGGEGTYDRVVSKGVEISAAEFQKLCDERDGWVYVTAFCAGSGMCKGLSLLGDTLTDHSCKGMNSCGGAGCVVLPTDTGLTGKEIYEKGPCGGCHGDWSDPDHPDFSVYTVAHGPDISDEDALARFRTSTDKRLTSIVVFGTMGLHADGTPYSNMPAYYQKYSLAEIRRAIAHVRSLPSAVSEYEIFGTTPGDGIPAGGAGGGTGGG